MTPYSALPLLNRRYQLIGPLGTGGMGTVYLAEDLTLARKRVAVKENQRATPDFQEQFTREARLLAHLNHYALPAVTDYFIEPDGRQYFVMEYIDGKNLLEIGREHGGPLNEEQVLGWMEKILSALAYMHRQSPPILHRDVKPGNIKLRSDGSLFLVDFGLAKIAEGDTVVGARGYTQGYASPEQHYGGTDVRSDIYAVGATLYYLLTNQRPPAAPELEDGAKLPPPRTLNPRMTRAVERVILKAMHLNPAERFQSVAEMQQSLGFHTSEGSQYPHGGGRAAGSTKSQRRSTSCLTQLLMTLLLVAILVLGARILLPLPQVQSTLGPLLPAPLVENWQGLVQRLAAIAALDDGTAPATPTATSAVLTPTTTAAAVPTTLPLVTTTALSPTAGTQSTPPRSSPSPSPPPHPPSATDRQCPDAEMRLITAGDHAFCLAQYEVTNLAYRNCVSVAVACLPIDDVRKNALPGELGGSAYFDDAQYDNHPVLNVTLREAETFCEEYGRYSQNVAWRLPTFAEWLAAYQMLELTPQEQLRQTLAVDDPQLERSSADIVALASNAGEWVRFADGTDPWIAVVMGESVINSEFPRTLAEVSNSPYITRAEENATGSYYPGFRCAADPLIDN